MTLLAIHYHILHLSKVRDFEYLNISTFIFKFIIHPLDLYQNILDIITNISFCCTIKLGKYNL